MSKSLQLAPLGGATTLHQAAVAHLRKAIILGELPPGAVLKDAEVAERLGLSTTPVREALVRLASEGLVEIVPNRTKRVLPIDYQATVELLEVQTRLWAIGYEWGGPRLTPEDFKRLAECNRLHHDALRRADLFATIEAANSFHLTVMQASGNRELVRITIDRLPLLHRFILLCTPSLPSGKTVKLHETLLRKLAAGEVSAALGAFKETAELALKAATLLRDRELQAEARRAAAPKPARR